MEYGTTDTLFYPKEFEWYITTKYYPARPPVVYDYKIESIREFLLSHHPNYFWSVVREFMRTRIEVTSCELSKVSGRFAFVYHFPSNKDYEEIETVASRMVSLLEKTLQES